MTWHFRARPDRHDRDANASKNITDFSNHKTGDDIFIKSALVFSQRFSGL